MDLAFNKPSSLESLEFILVGKLITNKNLHLRGIKDVLTSSWNLGSNAHIQPIVRNMVFCTFKHVKDRDQIEETGPWTVKGATLNLKPWPPEIPLNEIDFSTCKFWTQVHNLPPNCMNLENAVKMVNFICHFLKAERRSQIAKDQEIHQNSSHYRCSQGAENRMQ